jgi:hypothetical protein
MSDNANDTFNDLFVPDSETARKYSEQVRAVLDGIQFSDSIDMGSLPLVYSELGIKDKNLRTNQTTILKAIGTKGQNPHHVPKEAVEKLLALIHDPEGVFMSLSASQDPNAYVAVLNAKSNDGKQIIAILRPSKNGKGHTFIPSIYEREKFDWFVKKSMEERKILYVKEKGSELWGRLQLPPRHNSEPINNILPKEDIVKRILQKNPEIRQDPRETEKTNKETYMDADEITVKNYREYIKEIIARDPLGIGIPITPLQAFNIMQNEITQRDHIPKSQNEELVSGIKKDLGFQTEPQWWRFTQDSELNTNAYLSEKMGIAPQRADNDNIVTRNKEDNMAEQDTVIDTGTAPREAANSPEERAFLTAIHQRKVVADALKGGTLSCLPGAEGTADTEPAVNIANGTRYHGSNLLFLKEHQKQNGFPTPEYVTLDAIKKSGIPIRDGQLSKIANITFSEKNEQSGEWENKTVRLVNVAQTVRPWEMKQWAADKIGEEARERQEFLKKQFGDSFVPQEKKEPAKGPDVACTSTEPEKYLGQYLAAVSMGSKFTATPEQAAEFSKNFEAALFAKNANGHSNPFELSKICANAGTVCKETMKQAYAQERAARQQTREQTQSHSMGR